MRFQPIHRRAALAGLAGALGITGSTIPTPAIAQPDAIDVVPPELTGDVWINTERPIRLASRKGQVTLVHYWTFGCINCKRNLSAYDRWYEKYKRRGLEIIGVHTPEVEAEKLLDNVKKKVQEYGIAYPVLVDGDAANWRRWGQRWWPTIYLIDRRGVGRYRWAGELEYQNAGGERAINRLIDQLLQER